MILTAIATWNGLDITEVLNIGSDGMILFLTEDDRYGYAHEDEIVIDWRTA